MSFGADLQSAINDFAHAYMSTWEAGEDKATVMKNVVDNRIRNTCSCCLPYKKGAYLTVKTYILTK